MFWCAAEGIGSVSSGAIWGVPWGGRIGACPDWNNILACGFNLGGGAGAASGVDSGVSTLRSGVEGFCFCGISVVGGDSCGRAAMLKI